MKGKYKALLGIILVLIAVVIVFLVLSQVNGNKKTGTTDVEIKVLDNIEKYGYSLDERDSKVMKSTYEDLKNILNEEKIDYESYAKTIAKLFVIDLFTMNNKTNKYDVGSVEYVYPDNKDNFKLNVQNTIYKQIENNVDGSRKQALPAVKSIIEEDLTKGKYKIGDKEQDSFVVSLKWNYDEDLGYDTEATITLVEKDSKVYVVSYVTGE